jgi:signal transduction histidine kinase
VRGRDAPECRPEAVDLNVRLAPSLDPVLAASMEIDRILMNLTVNGRHAMPDALGGTLRIEGDDGQGGRIVIELPCVESTPE